MCIRDRWKNAIGNWDQVTAYVEAAARKSDFERTELAKEKTGVDVYKRQAWTCPASRR